MYSCRLLRYVSSVTLSVFFYFQVYLLLSCISYTSQNSQPALTLSSAGQQQHIDIYFAFIHLPYLYFIYHGLVPLLYHFYLTPTTDSSSMYTLRIYAMLYKYVSTPYYIEFQTTNLYKYIDVLCHYKDKVNWTHFAVNSYLTSCNYIYTTFYTLPTINPIPINLHTYIFIHISFNPYTMDPCLRSPLHFPIFQRRLPVTSVRRSGLHAPGPGGTGALSHLSTVTAAHHPALFTV